MRTPAVRLRLVNNRTIRADGDFVLYWMTAFRRTRWNYALQYATEMSSELGRPLVVFEPLRVGYPHASDRFHRFVLDGMMANARALKHRRVTYYPYIEPSAGDGKGLFESLTERACLVVADDSPAFFLPRMLSAAAGRAKTRMIAVDSNGLLPLRAAEKVYLRAYDFRRFLRKVLPEHLGNRPMDDPLADAGLPEPIRLPRQILDRWPAATHHDLAADPFRFPIDHRVGVVKNRPGGQDAAREAMRTFVDRKLDRYEADRNDLTADATSGLSPYLHFGHISAHEIVEALFAREGVDSADPEALSGPAAAFFDQLVTWRELGFNMAWQVDDYDRYDSLPLWARTTLAEHESDSRERVYTREQFEAARTHDALWNAAQRQLTREGRIHNYLRMVWGKKILHWSRSSREAAETMVYLNDKYALDGRDPNSYSGIFWCLGRYDRPWGPERPVFGKVRYMSLSSTRRKLRWREYVEKYRE